MNFEEYTQLSQHIETMEFSDIQPFCLGTEDDWKMLDDFCHERNCDKLTAYFLYGLGELYDKSDTKNGFASYGEQIAKSYGLLTSRENEKMSMTSFMANRIKDVSDTLNILYFMNLREDSLFEEDEDCLYKKEEVNTLIDSLLSKNLLTTDIRRPGLSLYGGELVKPLDMDYFTAWQCGNYLGNIEIILNRSDIIPLNEYIVQKIVSHKNFYLGVGGYEELSGKIIYGDFSTRTCFHKEGKTVYYEDAIQDRFFVNGLDIFFNINSENMPNIPSVEEGTLKIK